MAAHIMKRFLNTSRFNIRVYVNLCKLFVSQVPTYKGSSILLRRTVENVGPLAFEKNNVKTC
jgi:hypothetical protein